MPSLALLSTPSPDLPRTVRYHGTAVIVCYEADTYIHPACAAKQEPCGRHPRSGPSETKHECAGISTLFLARGLPSSAATAVMWPVQPYYMLDTPPPRRRKQSILLYGTCKMYLCHTCSQSFLTIKTRRDIRTSSIARGIPSPNWLLSSDSDQPQRLVRHSYRRGEAEGVQQAVVLEYCWVWSRLDDWSSGGGGWV